MTSDPQDRFSLDCQNAIRGKNVAWDLYRVAIQMRLEGLSQDQAYQIITSAKEMVTGTIFFKDTANDDAIADVLDGVVGYCSPSDHIWSSDFDVKKTLANLEKRDGGASEI